MVVARLHPVPHELLIAAKLNAKIIIESDKPHRIGIRYVSIELKYSNNTLNGVGNDFFIGGGEGSNVAPSKTFMIHLRKKVGGEVVPILTDSQAQKPMVEPLDGLTTRPAVLLSLMSMGFDKISSEKALYMGK